MFHILFLSQRFSAIHSKCTEICRLCCSSAELQEASQFYSIKTDLDVNCLKLEIGHEPVLIMMWYSLSPMRHLIFLWRNRLHIGHPQPESLDWHLCFLNTHVGSLTPFIEPYLFFTCSLQLILSLNHLFFNSCHQPDASHSHLSHQILNDLFCLQS